MNWKSPSLNAHNKVLQAYSKKYPAKAERRWRPLLRPAFIAFTVLVLITFVFLFNLTPGVVNAGYIENVTGQVEMLNSTTGEWNAVSPGQSVPVDASIRSLSDSQAVISFPGGEQTVIGSKSEVHLATLSESQGFWEIALEQVSGQTENQTSQKTHSFTVRTQAGIANSSNAHFIMTIYPDGSVVTRVIAGEVETRSRSQKSIIHTGETSIFLPDESFVGTPDFNENQVDPSLTPSQTPTLTPELTTTPTDDSLATRTPTPTGFYPTQAYTPDYPFTTSSSINNDITCSPGNSNGAGNSENASNSSSACK
ncbi:MAG TPA: hypothetical protein DEG92_00740 [Rikenellaceae bacterium]|nr:hypothetical protein [Rikenellaceae bacterium]